MIQKCITEKRETTQLGGSGEDLFSDSKFKSALLKRGKLHSWAVVGKIYFLIQISAKSTKTY
jgi:hypothetical protein